MNKAIELGPLSEIPVGSAKTYSVEGTTVAVFHEKKGVFALDDACPHQGGPLSQGFVVDGKVNCPWHQWEFCLKDGRGISIPAMPVKSYPVKIKDGTVCLQLEKNK